MRPGRAITVICGLLAAFGVLAHLAVSRTSVTFDETLHVTGAYVIRHAGDFRVNPEDPPLFERVAGLALPLGSIQPNYRSPQWDEMPTNLYAHWQWVNEALFGGPKDPVPPGTLTAIDHAREMMLPVAILLGAATAALAGAISRRSAWVAAVVATAIFSFDPTVLGHASLVKNDVFLTLSFTLTALAVAKVGERVTWGWLALLAAAPAIGMATKFTGLLLGPAVTLALLARAFARAPWPVLGWTATTRLRRAAVVAGIVLCCSVVTWAGVWAAYGFRFAMTPAANQPDVLQFEPYIAQTNLLWQLKPEPPHTDEEIRAMPVPRPMRAMIWAAEHRLVPQAFAKGFNHTYASTLTRYAFLLDQISSTGWWYYFPATLAFKLPLGTLGLLAVGIGVGATAAKRREFDWRVVGPGIIVAYYFLTAMSGNLNLGIRHLLPILPISFALAAVAVARLWDVRRMRVVSLVLLAGLAAESLSANLSYISFFNVPARMRGPEHLLSDSCLDWGQDIPALVEWQNRPENRGRPLSFGYFGMATPEAYGLQYVPLQGTSYAKGEVVSVDHAPPGVVALSATLLQSVYLKPEERATVYELFRRLTPREVLGGTIFLYNWPPAASDLAPHPWEIGVRVGKTVTPLSSGKNPNWARPR